MGRLEPVIGTEIITRTDGNEIRLGHTWYEVQVLIEFFSSVNVKHIFEIGVHEGGLSYVLIPILQFDVIYHGIELDCGLIRPEVKDIYEKYKYRTELICKNCFDPDVFGMIKSSSPKIIYCDGGRKAQELLHYKFACNPGDIVMTHDFFDGTRRVRGVPDENVSKEVVAVDIQHMENDSNFERLPEYIFKETRIIGWKKIK